MVSAAVEILAHAEPRRLSRDEYDRLAEQGFFRGERVELIEGMVVRMSPIGPSHADPVDVLNELFVRALPDRARVRTQQPFIAGPDSEPEPDVALVPPGRYATSHPDRAFLIVEVADSSLAHDRETKARLYAAALVPEYWVLDVRARTVHVFDDIVDGRYSRIRAFAESSALSPKAFPDVSLSVAQLFA
jgi:Uma2 family endonuclease